MKYLLILALCIVAINASKFRHAPHNASQPAGVAESARNDTHKPHQDGSLPANNTDDRRRPEGNETHTLEHHNASEPAHQQGRKLEQEVHSEKDPRVANQTESALNNNTDDRRRPEGNHTQGFKAPSPHNTTNRHHNDTKPAPTHEQGRKLEQDRHFNNGSHGTNHNESSLANANQTDDRRRPEANETAGHFRPHNDSKHVHQQGRKLEQHERPENHSHVAHPRDSKKNVTQHSHESQKAARTHADLFGENNEEQELENLHHHQKHWTHHTAKPARQGRSLEHHERPQHGRRPSSSNNKRNQARHQESGKRLRRPSAPVFHHFNEEEMTFSESEAN